MISTANNGTIELLYKQLYAPTTLAPARDFWLLRYTSPLEDGSLVICERSLNNTQNGPSMPPVPHFVRAEMLPSGYLIRPCEGGGSIIHIVDHVDLEPLSVPEVLRPLYESSTLLAQRTTLAAFSHLRQISQEISQPTVTSWGRRPAALRALGQRMSRGFNEAVNGFAEEGWSRLVTESDGVDDVSVFVNLAPTKVMGANPLYAAHGFPVVSNAVLCAKASMLLQDVGPAMLMRFLREYRSEWADSNMDAYSAASVKAGPTMSRSGCAFGSQVILPLAHTLDHEEFMEVVKLESMGHYQDNMMMPSDIFFLQLCNGVDEKAIGSSAELVFAPIDASFTDDAPLLPSGFRIIPINNAQSQNPTRDLASTLEVGPPRSQTHPDHVGPTKSVMTIAFQFAFEIHLQESIAAMGRQYVRSIISSVQRVALALSPSPFGPRALQGCTLGTPEAHTLTRWIHQSYSCFLGDELFKTVDDVLKTLWNHSDAITCCSLKTLPVFTFANQAGLDMLETTLVSLQDVSLETIFDDNNRKNVFSQLPQILQQGYACLPGGVCLSSMGRPVSYERVVAWKVLNDDHTPHCIAFMFINWSFV